MDAHIHRTMLGLWNCMHPCRTACLQCLNTCQIGKAKSPRSEYKQRRYLLQKLCKNAEGLSLAENCPEALFSTSAVPFESAQGWKLLCQWGLSQNAILWTPKLTPHARAVKQRQTNRVCLLHEGELKEWKGRACNQTWHLSNWVFTLTEQCYAISQAQMLSTSK